MSDNIDGNRLVNRLLEKNKEQQLQISLLEVQLEDLKQQVAEQEEDPSEQA